MSTPPPGSQHDRVGGEVGWARELRERPEPPSFEPLEESLWATVKRVVVAPRAAMVDLGRDVDAVRKGVIITAVYAVLTAVLSLTQSALGYPPETALLDGIGWLWVLLGVPLTLLGTLLAAYVLRLSTPAGLDRRVGTAFARLSFSWAVPSFGLLWLSLLDILLLASGVYDPDGLALRYEESVWLIIVSLLLVLWPLVITAIAIRVATERNWLMVIVILAATTVVALLPALFPLLVL